MLRHNKLMCAPTQFETTVKDLQTRVSTQGNADRTNAYELLKEGRDTKRGLIVILKAQVDLNE